MSTGNVTIYKIRYPKTKRFIRSALVVVSVALICSYAFLIVGSTVVSSNIKQLDRDSSTLQSEIAVLEVQYFTSASNIGPDDVSHLTMKQVPENAISYLVLDRPNIQLASAR